MGWVSVWGYENKESRLCRVGWRLEARELRGYLKANPPMGCEGFMLVDRMHGFCVGGLAIARQWLV